MRKHLIQPNTTFGFLTTLKKEKNYWLCSCICNAQKLIRQDHLISKATSSCGCKRRELNKLKRPPNYSTTFLDKPSEVMAYFLGIFMADGWVDEKGMVYLSQVNKKIINDIAKATNYKNKIQKIEMETAYGKTISYRISYAYDIKDKMKNMGFTNKKTGYEFIPQCITDEIFNHFLRGLFDGDGTIGITKGKKVATSAIISASKEFLETILIYLKGKKIIVSNKIKIRKRMGANKPCYRLRLAHHDTISLCNYMYNSATIKLDYKYQKYQKAKSAKIAHNIWSFEELDLLKKGIAPLNRAKSSISIKRKELGLTL